MEEEETEIKYVIINCEKCNENIHVPVPVNIIEESNIPKTPVVYVHKRSEDDDPHSIIAYFDRDFGDRATRIPDILILHIFPFWLNEKQYFL
jgi:hypothetical protein